MTVLSKGAEDGGQFAKTLGQFAERGLTYDELTGKTPLIHPKFIAVVYRERRVDNTTRRAPVSDEDRKIAMSRRLKLLPLAMNL